VCNMQQTVNSWCVAVMHIFGSATPILVFKDFHDREKKRVANAFRNPISSFYYINQLMISIKGCHCATFIGRLSGKFLHIDSRLIDFFYAMLKQRLTHSAPRLPFCASLQNLSFLPKPLTIVH
jgi:hypothetical protein